MALEDLKNIASAIKQQTKVGGNTAAIIGDLFEKMLDLFLLSTTITQSTGTDPAKVMSQKVVTQLIISIQEAINNINKNVNTDLSEQGQEKVYLQISGAYHDIARIGTDCLGNAYIEYLDADQVSTKWNIATKELIAAIMNKDSATGLNRLFEKLAFNVSTAKTLTDIGEVFFNATTQTLELKMTNDVTLQIGQEMLRKVKNDAGVVIGNGKLVYVSGGLGANALVKLATTDDANAAQRTFGMATQDITVNGTGFVTLMGDVNGLNTSGITEGAELWLGTSGNYTTTEPTGSTPKIYIGRCLRSHATQGVIGVNIRPIPRMHKLSGVSGTPTTTGQIYRYNATTSCFELYDLTAEFNKAESYNVTTRVPLSAGQYYDLTSAIAAVPSTMRKIGLKLTYLAALYHKETLTVSAIPTTAGNITITLNGVAFTVAVDPSTDTTTTLVANKIRAAAFTGWTISGTGATVIFTKNAVGVCSSPAFNAGTTGTTATIVTTVAGTSESFFEYQYNASSTTNWTTLSNWRRVANEVDLNQIGADLNKSNSEIEKLIEKTDIVKDGHEGSDLELTDDNGYILAKFSKGNIATKNFNSANFANSATGFDVEYPTWIQYSIKKGHRYHLYCTYGISTNVSTTLDMTTDIIERVLFDSGVDMSCDFKGGVSTIFKANFDANYLRFGNQFKGFIIDLDQSDYASNAARNNYLVNEPLVKLEIPTNLRDISEELATFDLSTTPDETGFNGQQRIMEQIYDKMDALIDKYPSIITKIDAYDDLGLLYPEYANLGGVSSGIYQATPSYKTWLYKLSYDTKFYTTSPYSKGVNSKQKILLYAGEHGQERPAQVNLYMLVKHMLDLSDMELFKLLSAFDVYVLPCLCGYGIYHGLRTNFDYEDGKGGVNINRNYPASDWTLQGQGTYNYGGSAAGSEKETQVIMGLINKYNFVVILDLHAYGESEMQQFYTLCSNLDIQRISYQSLTELSYIFKKAYPQYFGIQPQIILGAIGNETTQGGGMHWVTENYDCIGATIEVSQTINFVAGEYNPGVKIDDFGNDSMSIAELTLRLQILKIAQYFLNKINYK